MLVDGASANSLQSNASQQAESTLLANADSEASSENTDKELGQEDEEPDCDQEVRIRTSEF